MPDHTKWANKQIQAATVIGVNVLDATKAVQWVLDNLPPGADPATYTFPGDAMEQDISDPRFRDDAVSAWVANDDIDSRFKLIILAGDESIA